MLNSVIELPVEMMYSSSIEKRTLVTKEEWPEYLQNEALGLTQGNLKSLSLEKSSPDTMTSALVEERSTELISRPLEQGGQMPWTDQPKMQVYVAHFSSLSSF